MRQVKFKYRNFRKAVIESADIYSADEPKLGFIKISTTVSLTTNLGNREIDNTDGQVTRLAHILWRAEQLNFVRDRMSTTDFQTARQLVELALMDLFSQHDTPQFKRVQGRLFKSAPYQNIDVEDDSFHWIKDRMDRFRASTHNNASDITTYIIYNVLHQTMTDLLPATSTNQSYACSQFAHFIHLPLPATGYSLDINQVCEALIKCCTEHDHLLKAKKHYSDKLTAEKNKGNRAKPGEKFTDTEKKLDTVNTILSGCELLTAQYTVLARQLIAAYSLAESEGNNTLTRTTSFSYDSMKTLQAKDTPSDWCDDTYIRGMVTILRNIIDSFAYRATLPSASTGGATGSSESKTAEDAGAPPTSTAAAAYHVGLYATDPTPRPAIPADAGLLADTDGDVDTTALVPSLGGTTSE
ncbi:MAG: hypothetical protein P1U40_05010 [Coxiellaceae bacterium]|nr:hypothetical protein [Coxiellaceae bacterium]